ncbi:DUF533 domain-containing protein [Maritimibacter sp. DP1N21-5]|uniref:DUF533 domain-containing protein n=1 Tax=Maritimibacter sp. DP1N21-5 TaxID=2836867 RepID=UPI001C473706|nr:DUF533 domain-containing protein [Maritimibacter sp. DP1N21-5]MBV7410494.1 tellurite resistance TerB family protein [Maritimibacter sp. DP1N21-5]
MSFVRTLATLAVGFAAAKGVQKVRDMGGMDALRKQMREAGKEGTFADQMGQMAEKYGMPGGAKAVRDMMGRMGNQAADMSEATEAGMGSLIAAMTGAAKAGSGQMSDMFASMTAGTPVGRATEENAKLMIRAMIMAAKSDGEIDPTERKQILDMLDDASDEEIAFVEAELAAPVDPMALATSAGENAKTQVYSSALMGISVDTDAEKMFLRNLATGLQLTEDQVAEIHDTMGKPRP